MDKTREVLKSIGLPRGDAYDLPTSEKKVFSDSFPHNMMPQN